MSLMPIPRTLHVEVDTRENLPALFPDQFIWYPETNPNLKRTIPVYTHRVTLVTGDYRLQGRESAVVERKGRVSELHNNLFGPNRPTFLRALDRLALIPCAWLLCDFSPRDFLRPTSYCERPRHVLDELLRACESRRIRLMLAGPYKTLAGRRALGDLILRLLLNASWIASPSLRATEPGK